MPYPGLGPITVRATRGKGPATKKKAKRLQAKKEQDKREEFGHQRKYFTED